MAYSAHCRKMGLEMGYANRDAKEFARQLGSMATVSQTARGKISELSEAFVNAKVMYKNMTDEEKKGEFGKNLAASLDQLKSRLNSAKQDLADVNKELAGGGKFGEFGNIIDTIGSKLGVSGNLTEMLTSKTAMLTGAVGAGIAIVTKATEAWAGYNAELAKQDQITTVTTGLKGDAANQMTDQARALADTYNVDFREAINAANTLMTQFGESGEQAMQLIKDGMQGMIQGDGPKLLQMIQQYAPAFRDAGVSASQLVAVIQNSEGGIFTDQNMNAIVMGIKNIRLMTKATSDALAQLGIDGDKMSQQLSNGTLTIFDALKQVAGAISNVDSNSKAAGEVMQQVFGRQGVTAGTNLGKAIETLNTNLEQTKKQTGEVGEALADLQTANEKLNKAIRDCFEYDGWDQMAKGIQAKLVTALATVLDYIGKIKGSLTDFVGGAIKEGEQPKPEPKYKNGAYWERKDEKGNVTSGRYWNNQQVSLAEYEKLQKAANAATNIIKPTKGGGGGTTAPTYAAGSIAEQAALVSDLTKKMNESGEAVRSGLIPQLVEAEDKLKQMKDDAEYQKDLARGKFQGGMSTEGIYQGGIIPTEKPESLMSKGVLDEKAMKAVTKQITDQNNKKIKDSEKSEVSMAKEMSGMAGGVSQMVGGLEQLGIEIPQGMKDVLGGIQAISTILSGIMAIVSAIEVIAGADTIIPFAHGGVVKAAGGTVAGTTYSGDQIPALLNAGEVVLNRAQVSNLASTLEGGGMQGMKLSATISGEQIRLVLNNNGRRTGKGEYVQTNFR